MLTPEENEMLTRTSRNTPMGELFRRFWAPVLLTEEVSMPDSVPTKLKVMGQDLVAFRDSRGKLGLLDARCPHRGASLALGYNHAGRIRCPVCSWVFDTEGNCVELPMEPEETGFRKSVRVPSYPTVERAGVIWAYLGPQTSIPKIPEFEWLGLPENHCYKSKYLVECNYAQAVEAGIDASRVSFSTDTYDAGRPDLHPINQAPWDIYGANESTQRIYAKSSNFGVIIGVRTEAGDKAFAWRSTHWLFPFYTTTLTESGGLRGGIAWVPSDDETTMALAVTYHPSRPLTAKELEDCHNGKGLHPEKEPGTYYRKSNRSNNYRIDGSPAHANTLASVRSIQERALICQESMGIIVDRTWEELGPNDVPILIVRDRLLKSAIDLLEGTEPTAANEGEEYRISAQSIILERTAGFNLDTMSQTELPENTEDA